MSPTGIMELLEQNISVGNENLQKMSFDLLCDRDGLNLRDYQLKAVQAVENAVIAGQKNILLAMATGTGKTRTILGMIYRFLKSGRFRRILFLVDRNSLGEQAQDVFKEVKLEDLMTLEEIYNIKKLEERNFEKETRIQVATVQSMVKRIIYNEENFIPAVTDYDLIIINEAHRGYILDKEISEDELNFDVENFNRQVVNENFNRVILEEISKSIDPDGLGKTLIYAVDDKHADLIVQILKEIYSTKGVSNEAVMKITGSVGDKRRINEAIRKFKNERYPNIVVTVDLLTTGIDVPQIDKLVFMSRVKSRILFEQMLGRATRLCPEIGKTHFEIYDAVGVYESLEPVSEMRPVVVNPTENFSSLLEKLKISDDDKQIQKQINQIIGKLQRTKNKFSSSDLENFKSLSGGKTPEQFADEVKKLSPQVAKNFYFVTSIYSICYNKKF